MIVRVVIAGLLAAATANAGLAGTPDAAPAGLPEALNYSFIGDLVVAEDSDRLAWVTNRQGIRSVWTATGPDFRAQPIYRSKDDDGQELTGLRLSSDGRRAVWTRGGDHDANWPAAGDLQPNPASAAQQSKLTIWSVDTSHGAPVMIDEGDAPVLSDTGRIAYLKGGKVWIGKADGEGKPELAFFDSGDDRALAWSPDGQRLAFVSHRDDHSLVGVFSGTDKPIIWLAPSTGFDESPVWSSDGKRIAFTRRGGAGGAPEPFLKDVPHPWSIMVADAASGVGQAVWKSPRTPDGSFPEVPDGVFLRWAAGDRLTFRAEMDGWPHLYALPASGGTPLLLTPGKFMVEHVRLSRDGRSLLYDANTGMATGDDDRRHIFRVPVDAAQPMAITQGDGIEFTAVPLGLDDVAFVATGPARAPELRIVDASGRNRLVGESADGYHASMVVPTRVTFRAADGLLIHGQLFAPSGSGEHPALIFVHGGPPRQMLLGFPYMDYYAHAYAMNQYLASRGFVVLSVNYRLGIGYGRSFQHAEHAGPAGGSEYRDVQAGAAFLRTLPGVDDTRIGIWGGSYGGYLTAMALARDSGTFKAGVDLHGVHDWSRLVAEEASPAKRYEQGDWDAFLKTAWESSPVAAISTWRSPVLLIQGDDDRNVRFNQTIDLARRLDAQGVEYEELVLPNEIHGFLRYRDWLAADAATVRFLETRLKP